MSSVWSQHVSTVCVQCEHVCRFLCYADDIFPMRQRGIVVDHSFRRAKLHLAGCRKDHNGQQRLQRCIHGLKKKKRVCICFSSERFIYNPAPGQVTLLCLPTIQHLCLASYKRSQKIKRKAEEQLSIFPHRLHTHTVFLFIVLLDFISHALQSCLCST